MSAKPIIKSRKSALFYAAVLVPVVLFGMTYWSEQKNLEIKDQEMSSKLKQQIENAKEPSKKL
jgi:predicted negative regulator of RcsB-dependent stress response